jgi:hypothetical protein
MDTINPLCRRYTSHEEVYDELDNLQSGQQTRILRLRSGKENEGIVCDTITVNLDDKPTYTALSYVWGSTDDPTCIVLNETHDFPITRNLGLALRYLRKQDEDVILWVDALSINQQNNEEKSIHVSHMDEIYKRATETRIWLGEEADDSDHAINVLERLDIDDFDSEANNLDARALNALGKLQQREWWFRVWMIQGTTSRAGVE